MEQQAVVVKQRTWVLMAVLAAMFAGYPLLRRSPWLGSTELHTLMELLATTLALFVGCLAFLRFYSKKNNTFLFIAGGFVGTGLLDAYHMVLTSHWFDQLWPLSPAVVGPVELECITVLPVDPHVDELVGLATRDPAGRRGPHP